MSSWRGAYLSLQNVTKQTVRVLKDGMVYFRIRKEKSNILYQKVSFIRRTGQKRQEFDYTYKFETVSFFQDCVILHSH
jgi:hypothetical protein